MRGNKRSVTGKWRMLLACFILLCNHAGAQPKARPKTAIQFLNKDLNSALVLSKRSHKLVFVDAYTTWCAPCQQLKRQTFKNKRIAAYFNSHYINIAIDVEKDKGGEFAEQYGVNGYPTMLFIDNEGKVIKRIEGFVDAKQLHVIASSVK